MNKKRIFEEFDKLKMKAGRFLLAFSGGPDSVFLLYMLHEYYKDALKDRIAVCYINYHDSPFVNKEEKLVIDMISSFSLELFKYDTEYDRKKDGNFEDWARIYRYTLFESLCKKYGFTALLTAHQLTDSVETYILQKERKNLPLFYGLPPKTTLNGMMVYRPILSISKSELTQFLIENGISFYDDITNYDNHTKRNLIRKEEIPVSKQREIQKEIDSENLRISGLYHKFSLLSYPISFSDYDCFSEEEKRRLLFFLLKKENLNVSSKRLAGLGKEAYEFLNGRSVNQMELSDEKSLFRNCFHFFIDKTKQTGYSYIFDKPGRYETEKFIIDLSDPRVFNIPSFPFIIRNCHDGDTIDTNLKEKNVTSFLEDQEIPNRLKKIYPVFEYQGKIKYVPFFVDIRKKRIPFTFKVLY